MNTEAEPKLTDSDEESSDPSTISSPALDEKGKPTKKAINSHGQAKAIAKNLWDTAETGRLKTAVQVLERFNGSAPFKAKDLKAAQQAWRNNFSTNFLGSIVARIAPQLKDPTQRATSLTHSRLPSSHIDASKKSRFFCEKITEVIRGWDGWADLISIIATDDVLFGSSVVAFLDDDWRPMVFRFDEAFLPENSGQSPSKIGHFMVVSKVLLHELLDKIDDEEIAKAAGFDIKGCREAINAATQSKGAASEETELEKENSKRETGGTEAEYNSRDIVVRVWNVLVREYSGGIALWSVAQDGGHPIRYVPDLHKRMQDAVALFTIETGNALFYGSKGIGRMLANIHTAIERLRCIGADMLWLSSMMVLKGDAKDFNQQAPIVRHPFIIIPSALEISPEAIGFQPDAHRAVLDDLIATAESISGAFIPPNIDNQGSSNTKIEAAQKAERELSIKQGVQGRFFQQFADMIDAIQRKICSPDNLREALRIFEERKAQTEALGAQERLLAREAYEIFKEVAPELAEKESEPPSTTIGDPQAVDAIVAMMEEGGMSIKEIITLAITPSGNNVQENTASRDADTVAFIDANAVNQFIDQHEATRMKAEIVLGADRADRIVLDDKPDPNEEASQSRLQIIEWSEMMAGNPMPVASTDNHAIHIRKLGELLNPVMQSLDQMPPDAATLTSGARLMIEHLMGHNAMNTESSDEEKQALQQTAEQAMKFLDQKDREIEAMAQQAAKEQEAMAQQQQAAGGGAGGGGPVPDPKVIIDGMKTGAEIQNKAKDQELRQQELDLARSQHEHQVGMDLVNLQKDATQQVINQANTERDAGLREAEADRRAQPV